MTMTIPRRAPRGGSAKTVMPSFSLNLPTPTNTRDVPVEDIKAKDTERLFIDMDGSMISPFMTTEPGWGAPSHPPPLGSHGNFGQPGHGSGVGAAANPHTSRKFFRVDDKNMFIYIADEKPENDDDSEEATPLTKADVADTTEDSIPLEELEMHGPLGSGAQGSVRACRHNGVDYAIKTIPVSDALDRTQADVERQARKAAVVRELKMVAKKKQRRCEHVVAVYNAYFQRKDLLILMERMTTSLEDLQVQLNDLSWEDVKPMAQRIFGSHFSGASSSGKGAGAGGTSGGVGSGLTTPQDFDGSASPHTTGRSPLVAKGGRSNASSVAGVEKAECKKQTVGWGASTVQRRCPLPEVVISLIARDALLGLCNFHDDLRVVHTDLKPANLMFSQNRHLVKLADFGCNMELTSNGTIPHDSGVALGTKLYMSPERWTEVGQGFDAKCDIWSLGITLMELANGCHPCEHFKANFWSFQDMLRVDKMIRPQHCSQICYDFLAKCLTRDPCKRPSAKDLLRHEFIQKFANAPRKKLATFLQTLATESRKSHIRKAQTKMQRFISDGVHDKAVSDTKNKNVKLWKGYSKGLGTPPPSMDDFPALV